MKWIAECRGSRCVHGTLVTVFADRDARNEWAAQHTLKLGHEVHRYARPH